MSQPTAPGETAEKLILVGLIVQAIFIGIYALIAVLVEVALVLLAVLASLWLVTMYVYSYQRVRGRDYAGARTPTLAFGILCLFSGSIISAILFLIAYAKLGDAQLQWSVIGDLGGAASVPVRARPGPLPSAGARCPNCGQSNPGSALFCQSCGASLRSPAPGAGSR